MSVEQAPEPQGSGPARRETTAATKRKAAVILGIASACTFLVAQAGQSGLALAAAATPTVNCPSVAGQVTNVPAAAKAEVDRNLALLDTQIAEANKRIVDTVGQGGPNFIQNAILGPLKDKRVATLDRIAIAIGRTGAPRPVGLESLAPCTLNAAGGGAGAGAGAGGGATATPPANGGNAGNGGNNGNAGNGGNAGAGNGGQQQQSGPVASDFVDIRQVPPKGRAFQGRRGANSSRGTFLARCGNNANGHRNPDNFIVAPGVSNGAQHTHDYVGNLSTTGFSTDASLRAAGTTCANGDKSAYFWPVLRDRSKRGGGADGNIGQILSPQVKLEFRGNRQSKVRPMPQTLRAIMGDAKTLTNGPANARAQWTCTGFTNRITQKYPLCPAGSNVVRILDFPSCLQGNSTDSANHRTHILFPDATGRCPNGTSAVPQLRMTLTYRIANGRNMALDTFPNQFHSPATDHADFANFMPNGLMNRVVGCINQGRRC